MRLGNVLWVKYVSFYAKSSFINERKGMTHVSCIHADIHIVNRQITQKSMIEEGV